MAKNFVQNGATIDFVAQADVSSGDVVIIGDIAVIALSDVKSGESGVGQTHGVWNVSAKQEDDITTGDILYWSDADNQATKTATDNNTKLGIAWRDSGAGSASVDVKLTA